MWTWEFQPRAWPIFLYSLRIRNFFEFKCDNMQTFFEIRRMSIQFDNSCDKWRKTYKGIQFRNATWVHQVEKLYLLIYSWKFDRNLPKLKLSFPLNIEFLRRHTWVVPAVGGKYYISMCDLLNDTVCKDAEGKTIPRYAFSFFWFNIFQLCLFRFQWWNGEELWRCDQLLSSPQCNRWIFDSLQHELACWRLSCTAQYNYFLPGISFSIVSVIVVISKLT